MCLRTKIDCAIASFSLELQYFNTLAFSRVRFAFQRVIFCFSSFSEHHINMKNQKHCKLILHQKALNHLVSIESLPRNVLLEKDRCTTIVLAQSVLSFQYFFMVTTRSCIFPFCPCKVKLQRDLKMEIYVKKVLFFIYHIHTPTYFQFSVSPLLPPFCQVEQLFLYIARVMSLPLLLSVYMFVLFECFESCHYELPARVETVTD